MVKFIMILKQISKFVQWLIKRSFMNIKKMKYLLIYLTILSINIQFVEAQCEWLYENRETGSYILEDLDGDGEQDNVVLFYCENFMDTIYAPSQYSDVFWEYITESGQECQDWDWTGDNFFFSVNYNDPCIESLNNNTISVSFIGTADQNSKPDICSFDILFNDPGQPVIEIENYNTDEQIIICEDDNITLTASTLGSNPNYSSFSWYLNGELIE